MDGRNNMDCCFKKKGLLESEETDPSQNGSDGTRDLHISTETFQTYDSQKTADTERGKWTGRFDFLLSAIGYAVGLGNVWRFPYKCYTNGGAVFLIPYTIMLAFAGLPMFFLELSFGQYASLGPISIWRISPLFTGLGYAMCTLSLILPWSDCDNDWNTCACSKTMNIITNATIGGVNCSTLNITKRVSPTEEYWQRYVLEVTPSINETGYIRWQLFLCNVLAWVVVFLCLIKGVKSSGKVVYFTATFPYVILFILMVRGATLPNSLEGVKFYIIPGKDDWKKLLDAKVWGDAAQQIFYSLGPGWGGLITMSSYNKFNNNCYRDALIVSITNCATSVFAGFVIFSVLGFMAGEMGVEVSKVVAHGPGLAFVAYPEGIARMPGAPFWAVLFFFMLFTLGLDSMFTGLEAIVSALTDEFLALRPRKFLVLASICVLGLILGIPCVTQAGMYWVQLLDWYAASHSLFLIVFLEVVVINYVYGYRRFSEDIRTMIGFKPNFYWGACWLVLTPLIILFIFVMISVKYEPVNLDGMHYPKWAENLGILTMAASALWIPIFMIIRLAQYVGSCQGFLALFRGQLTGETWRRLTSPSPEWGPALVDRTLTPAGQRAKEEHDAKAELAIVNPAMNLNHYDSIQFETHI
ncbi:unnamed protein product [Owenia fusiformis]|uniref:Transporter n=1 Tax=Owenia fusiformis TaxID=6347 RepID=A0A8S4Q5D9_OWEFU|nr:unnamed protein product [Owenia fusiformis]